MKIILVSVELWIDDNCNTCQERTQHVFEFVAYNFQTHEVTFDYFCSECMTHSPEEFIRYRYSVPIGKWCSIAQHVTYPDN